MADIAQTELNPSRFIPRARMGKQRWRVCERLTVEQRSAEHVKRSLSRWRRGDGMNRHELHACGAFVAVDVVAAGRWMLGE